MPSAPPLIRLTPRSSRTISRAITGCDGLSALISKGQCPTLGRALTQSASSPIDVQSLSGCRRRGYLRLQELLKLDKQRFPVFVRNSLLARRWRRGVILNELIEGRLQSDALMLPQPVGSRLEPRPTRHFRRQVDFLPFGMP